MRPAWFGGRETPAGQACQAVGPNGRTAQSYCWRSALRKHPDWTSECSRRRQAPTTTVRRAYVASLVGGDRDDDDEYDNADYQPLIAGELAAGHRSGFVCRYDLDLI